MFYAKPVVAFRLGGIPEVVGDATPLYEFGDVDGMTGELDSLCLSPASARETGHKLQKRAQRLFTAGKIVPLYETVYRECRAR